MDAKLENAIITGMARGLWVHAYMNWVEAPPNMTGTWEEITPPTPAGAIQAAKDLAKLIGQANQLGAQPMAEFYENCDTEEVEPERWGKHVAQLCVSPHLRRDLPSLADQWDFPAFDVHIEDGELVWDGEAEMGSAMAPDKRRRLEAAGWRVGDADDVLRNPAVPWPRARVQSLLFPKWDFTPERAKEWARSHGYKYGNVDTTAGYHRIRQFDPDGAECRTIRFGDSGIQAVVCAAARRNPGAPEPVVLHLEDDDLIQRGGARMLRKIFPGTTVITVDNVADAKRAVAEHPNLTAILSDVDVLGPDSGIDFFQWITANHPDLVDRYTFLTGGHPEAGEMHHRYLDKGGVTVDALRQAMTSPR